jgi:CRISPR-associated endonuclease Csn1
LFVKDIIFYQRPLRSQKSNIGNCALEFVKHKINIKDENGNPVKNVFEKDADGKDIIVKEYLKGIPKSNPYYQEFRVWQWLYNLKIYTREDDKDVTNEFVKRIADLEKLFEFLMTKKEVGNKDVIEFLIEENSRSAVEQQIREQFPKLNDEKIRTKVNSELAKKVKELLPKYRWNYVFDNTKEKEEDKSKKYPCNSTGYEIHRRLKDIENVPDNFLTCEAEQELWHIIYSVTDKNEFETALLSFSLSKVLDNNAKEIKDKIKQFFKENNQQKYDTKGEYQNALNNFIESSFEEDVRQKVYFAISFFENFKNFRPFKSEYGSFSEKAIKKLLPLMRLGKYWNENEISDSVKERAKLIKERLDDIKDEQTIENVADDDVQKQVLKSFFKFKNAELIDFTRGLQLYQASYLVYGRHSEAENADKWKMSYNIQQYLDKFKQHSLRNPIVEQVITETLRTVKDIWEQEAVKNNIQPVIIYDEHKKKEVKSYPTVFDEIHIELGREMKNTAEDRKAITNSVLNNETTNLRIKKMLLEFSQDDDFKNETGENTVRPHSPTQQDILKIFEDDVLSQYSELELKNQSFDNAGKDEAKNVFEISRKSQLTKAEVTRYKLWLEQKYQSPYTGQMIPLGKLFTPAYEIEHVIPLSRYFDDSFNNKVICEAEINRLKDNRLGFEFIKKFYGQKVQIGKKNVEIFTEKRYKEFVNQHYKNSNKKRKNLLLEEIPDKMIDRQLNDTRHISKFVSKLLSNIVRGETNDDGVNSTNLIPVTGKFTSKLKQSWGLNDKWNELILPRFERMNQITNLSVFTTQNKEGHTIPVIPLELSKGFQFKRIDHRHHALDALVIACTTREHVQYLNNENAKSQKFHLQQGLAKKLREFESVEIEKMVEKDGIWIKSDKKETREVPRAYIKPWDNFPIDAKNELEKIVVSFKQNLRVINKSTNYYQKYENGKKVKVKQQGINRAIRKPLHKETVYAKVYLLDSVKEMTIEKALEKVKQTRDANIFVDEQLRKFIKSYFKVYNDKEIQSALKNEQLKNIRKVNVFEQSAASRKSLDSTFNENKIKESVTDTGIQKILLNHLSAKDNNPEIAFSPEGIEEMNKNIVQLNNGKFHQPILKVRVYETIGNKFAVGVKGNKKDKYVEAAKGTNLFFAIYADENGNRTYETVPLNVVIERLKQGLKEVPEKNEKGHSLLFHLSPNDLVYVPTEEEISSGTPVNVRNIDPQRIYKLTDTSDTMANFIPATIANVIFNYNKDKQKKMGINYPIQNEIGVGSQGSKNERAITGEQIKKVCIKLKVDRLGNITEINGKN